MLPRERVRPAPTIVLAVVLGFMSAACETFDPPPEPELVGGTDGLLSDPNQPIQLRFSEPIDPASLRLRIVRYVADAEGNLPDEDDDSATTLDTFFEHDAHFDGGGTAHLDAGKRSLEIKTAAPLPIGPRLALLVEPGLSDVAGNVTLTRRRILFGYSFDLECGEPAKTLPSGFYFFLADVADPIPTQVQLFAAIEVDPATGNAIGKYTNADRNRDGTRCDPACDGNEACRTIPAMECVIPSEFASSVDEFVDYVPNGAPPTGYGFTATGCVHEQSDGTAVLVVAPVDVAVQAPPVTLRNARLVASFTPGPGGVLRATGSFSADAVLLGTTPSGAAKGDLAARSIADGEAPTGIPLPPPLPLPDGGTSSSRETPP
jgi:hypothetical protein